MKSPWIPIVLLLIAISGVGSLAQTSITNPVIELPFDFYRGAIIVNVTITNKGPFNMMLDTGVDPSVIDLDTAKAIGLKLATVGHQGTGGGTDKNPGYETTLPLVDLGALRARKIKALAIDLSNVSEAFGKPIQGILGYSLLRNRIVQIDYPKRVARFYAGSPLLKTAGPSNNFSLKVLRFRYRDEILIDDVTVNGRAVTANLDTGSNAAFQLTPAAVVKLGLQEDARNAPMSNSVGINGLSENREGKLKNITVGGVSVNDPTVVFYGNGTGHDKEKWDLRIGSAFLKDFVVTIDFRHQVVTFERP